MFLFLKTAHETKLVSLRKLVHAIFRKKMAEKMKFFSRKILIFFLFLLQNIDCGYSLEPPRRNLCFEAKIRKIVIPLQTPVLLYKSGVQGGKHYTDMFS